MTASRTILVEPAEEWAGRRRLFDALAMALDVRFVAGRDVQESAVAAIVFGADDRTRSIPTLALPAGATRTAPTSAALEFAEDAPIDRALRGNSLHEREIALESLSATDGVVVYASSGSGPVWIRRGDHEHVAAGLPELAGDAPLRSLLQAGSSFPLVAIVDFIRRVAPPTHAPPPPFACFLFDDPNLHSSTYGYVRFGALAADAAVVGYHAAFATIPLDGWYASPRALELFKANRETLSLLIHGNDHVRRELGRPLEADARVALLQQGMRRIEQFERRYGIAVAHVMAPPHGACSEEMAADLVGTGYRALCVSRPYPWLSSPPVDRPLAGWRPTEIVAGGLPIIPRLHLDSDRDEIILRSFLRQPLVLYGHHTDLRTGLTVLNDAAAHVRAAMPDAQWRSLEAISKGLYSTRTSNGLLDLRLHTRAIRVTVPEGVDSLAIDWPEPLTGDRVVVNGIAVAEGSTTPVAAGATVDVHVERQGLPGGARPPFRPWPYVRRALSESRDRLRPLLESRRTWPSG